jgi:type IV pilus assembly protein PilC
MCRRIGTSLDAGVDVRKIWEREAEKTGTTTGAHAAAIRGMIGRGDSMFEALEASGDYFPPLLRKLVRVGEQAGQLDKTFLQLANHYEHSVRLRKTFVTSLAWPAIQLGLAVCIIGLLIWVLGMVGNTDVLGFGLMGTSGLIKYLAFLTIVAMAIGVAIHLIRNVIGVGWVIHRATLLPVLGDFIRTLGLARFAWVLSLISETHTPVRPAVQMALDATINPYFTTHAAEIDAMLAKGEPINEALRGAFPPEFVDTVQVGEEAGKLAETMGRMAKNYEEQVQSQSSIIATVASFVVWAIVALIIIAMIFRLAMFYLGTIHDLSSP